MRRATLFRAAVTRHLQYAAWAADGQGVDRHLFGLKKVLKDGEPLPEIYNDPSFAKTSHWELSTSQLSSPYLDGWGYGEGKIQDPILLLSTCVFVALVWVDTVQPCRHSIPNRPILVSLLLLGTDHRLYS